MEKLPQELIDQIIDYVGHPDLRACSLVGRRWVERSHWRICGGGYRSFIHQRQLNSALKNLLTKGSIFAEHIHTLTLGFTVVQAWAEHFRDVDAVLPRLHSLIITDAWLRLHSDVAVLKRNFGNTLLSLSLNMVAIDSEEFYPIFSSFPNLDNLSITRLNLPPPPPGDIPACPRALGKLTLAGVEAHNTCVPFLLKLPIQFRTLHFCGTADVRKVHPLMRAYSSTLTTLEIRGNVWFSSLAITAGSKQRETDDVPRLCERGPPLAARRYPELQIVRFTLAALVTPRDCVALVLSSITSAPRLSEVTFVFTRATLDQDLDLAVNLGGWGLVDDQLCRLVQQSTGGITASFDFLTQRGWTPRRDDTGMSFMRGFRRFGVMKLRSFGEEVAAYSPRV